MKLLGALLFLTPSEVESKDIKQKMMENRLKFDRDVVIHGDDDDENDWDPWDLEDDELQSRLRKLVVRMDHNRDGYVDQEELTSKLKRVVTVDLTVDQTKAGGSSPFITYRERTDVKITNSFCMMARAG